MLKKSWIKRARALFAVGVQSQVTHPITFLNEVFPTDVCHDASGQSITHYIYHGAESISGNKRFENMYVKTQWICFLLENLENILGNWAKTKKTVCLWVGNILTNHVMEKVIRQKSVTGTCIILTTPNQLRWWEWCHQLATQPMSALLPWWPILPVECLLHQYLQRWRWYCGTKMKPIHNLEIKCMTTIHLSSI